MLTADGENLKRLADRRKRAAPPVLQGNFLSEFTEGRPPLPIERDS